MDGLAKASILDINGLTVPSAVATPAVAYSVRLLGSGVGISSYAGACMRVRRDTDNVEADVGFDSNNEFGLTSPVSNPSSGGPFTDFADFIGHGGGSPANGFVRWWYDQSGNSRDVGQATQVTQPKIYDSSTGIVDDGISSIPAIYWNGSNNLLSSTYTLIPQPITAFASVTFVQGSTSWIYNMQGDAGFAALSDSGARYEYWFSGPVIRTGMTNATGQNLPILLGDGANSTMWNNGSSGVQGGDAGSAGSDQIKLGGSPGVNNYVGYMNEFIMYPNDQESEGTRTTVQDNINAYFSIYP